MSAVDVMRSYITAMQSGDRQGAFDHFADDVVGHVPGRSTRAGELRGRAAVEGYILAAVAHAGGEVTVELIDMLVGEEHVGLLVHERLVAGDRVLDMRRMNVYRVRDERISEIWIFEGDQYAVDEFFAD